MFLVLCKWARYKASTNIMRDPLGVCVCACVSVHANQGILFSFLIPPIAEAILHAQVSPFLTHYWRCCVNPEKRGCKLYVNVGMTVLNTIAFLKTLFLKTMSVNDVLVLFTRSANSQHFWKDLFCRLTYLPSSYPRRDFNNMADIRRRLSLNEQWKFQRLVYLHERMAI